MNILEMTALMWVKNKKQMKRKHIAARVGITQEEYKKIEESDGATAPEELFDKILAALRITREEFSEWQAKFRKRQEQERQELEKWQKAAPIVDYFRQEEVLKRLSATILAKIERQKLVMLWHVKRYIGENTTPEERNQTFNEWLGEAYLAKNGETDYYFPSDNADNRSIGEMLIDEFGSQILTQAVYDEISQQFGIAPEELQAAIQAKDDNWLKLADSLAWDEVFQFCSQETPTAEFIMSSTQFTDQNEEFFHLDLNQTLKNFIGK